MIKQEGFVTVIILLIVLVLAGLVGAFYFGTQVNKENPSLQSAISPGQPSFSVSQPTNTISRQLSPTIIPTTDSTANWKNYENATYGFQFKFPPSFIVDDKLPTKNIIPIPPAQHLEIVDNLNEVTFSIYLNPDGFGPFFPDKISTVSYSEEKGIFVVKESLEDASKYRDDEFIQNIIPQNTILNGHNIFITFMYPRKYFEADKLFDQILSTFRFD